MKEIVGPVFELLGSISTAEGMTSLFTFLSRSTLTHWEYYAKVCNDSLDITIVMGSQIS